MSDFARARRILIAFVGLFVLASPLALAAEGSTDDYNDPDYAEFDADNMARTGQRQDYHLTTPGYHDASRETFLDTWTQGVNRQHRDADEGRVYAGVGQIVPGGNVGDPEAHHQGPREEVEFLNREGTKLVGNLWPCQEFLGDGVGCPLVVVTTGSIQVTQHMYGWLARHLQDHGYTVFTFDVRGQGESETTNQTDPFASNPQDGANFVDGTIDALRFALSTPDVPYSSSDDPDVSNHNPVSGAVDSDHIALVGHSLGASAVATVQQCSSAGVNPPVQSVVADTCGGDTWPIQAVVAYDGLSAGPAPVVPAFTHYGDGYFINAVPTPEAPDPTERTGEGSAFHAWDTAGVDVMALTGRGFTHAEWSQIPYIVSATRYGVPQATYYTLAWLDRFAHPAHGRAGHVALRDGPIPDETPGLHEAHRASLFSGKYASAIHVGALGDAPAVASLDLRETAGVAAVGAWAELNDEREYGNTERGAVSEAVQTERDG